MSMARVGGEIPRSMSDSIDKPDKTTYRHWCDFFAFTFSLASFFAHLPLRREPHTHSLSLSFSRALVRRSRSGPFACIGFTAGAFPFSFPFPWVPFSISHSLHSFVCSNSDGCVVAYPCLKMTTKPHSICVCLGALWVGCSHPCVFLATRSHSASRATTFHGVVAADGQEASFQIKIFFFL